VPTFCWRTSSSQMDSGTYGLAVRRCEADGRAGVVHPDVVVMDMRLADGNGAQATAQVLEVSPRSRILVLSASEERDDVLEAVKAGATGYLVKSASKQELGDAVLATAEGRAVFTPNAGPARRALRTARRGSQRACH
jgi:DNA-binding NarL/FixJ family response regulator